MAISRPAAVASLPSVIGSRAGGDWCVLFPAVVEYLAETRYSDGSERQTATLLVFIEEGLVKTCLSDRDLGRTAWATGASVEACLSSLEERLKADTCEWRTAGAKGRGKRR